MADQKRITLYAGHATPKTIVLRALPVPNPSPTTKIYMYAGHAVPKNIILGDPTVIRPTAAAPTSTAAGTFPALTGAAVGAQTIPSTAAGAFPALTGAAVGAQTIPSTAAGAFPALTGAAVGTQTIPSTAAGAFPALTGAASALHVGTPPILGGGRVIPRRVREPEPIEARWSIGAGAFAAFAGKAHGALALQSLAVGAFAPLQGAGQGSLWLAAEGTGALPHLVAGAIGRHLDESEELALLGVMVEGSVEAEEMVLLGLA